MRARYNEKTKDGIPIVEQALDENQKFKENKKVKIYQHEIPVLTQLDSDDVKAFKSFNCLSNKDFETFRKDFNLDKEDRLDKNFPDYIYGVFKSMKGNHLKEWDEFIYAYLEEQFYNTPRNPYFINCRFYMFLLGTIMFDLLIKVIYQYECDEEYEKVSLYEYSTNYNGDNEFIKEYSKIFNLMIERFYLNNEFSKAMIRILKEYGNIDMTLGRFLNKDKYKKYIERKSKA